MSESEQETTSEKKPAVVEQKSENFIEAAWRSIKALDGSTTPSLLPRIVENGPGA
jgi:hypothetical protein